MIDYHDYVGDRVKVIDRDDKIIEGVIIGYDVGIDRGEEYDAIDIKKDNGICIAQPISDIKYFEVLK